MIGHHVPYAESHGSGAEEAAVPMTRGMIGDAGNVGTNESNEQYLIENCGMPTNDKVGVSSPTTD